MINVILARTGTRVWDDFCFPVLDKQGGWYGMSTACSDDGNGRMDKHWCSFGHNQTWINTETHESIIITDEFLNDNSSYGWNLNEYGIKEFKRFLGTADEVDPDSEMPDIF